MSAGRRLGALLPAPSHRSRSSPWQRRQAQDRMVMHRLAGRERPVCREESELQMADAFPRKRPVLPSACASQPRPLRRNPTDQHLANRLPRPHAGPGRRPAGVSVTPACPCSCGGPRNRAAAPRSQRRARSADGGASATATTRRVACRRRAPGWPELTWSRSRRSCTRTWPASARRRRFRNSAAPSDRCRPGSPTWTGPPR